MNELLKYTYEGSEVTFSNEGNVMVNATQMAKAFGKRPNDWLSLPSTKDFLDELTITRKSGNVEYQAVITKKGGLNPDGENVMVNATQMAKAFGKRPNDWLNLQSTKDFLDELTDTRKSGNVEYQAVITKSGRNLLYLRYVKF